MDNLELDTGFALLNFLSDKACLVEYKYGVNVTADKAELVLGHIEQQLEGDYVVIENRIRDCSLSPLEVYAALNRRSRLKAVALVLHRQVSFIGVNMEKHLYHGPLQSFRFISDAYAWGSQVVHSGYLESPGLQHQGKTAE